MHVLLGALGFCCQPSEELESQGLFGVHLGSLVQGSGAYPMMQGQNSQRPCEKTEADRSAKVTGTQGAVVHLAIRLCDGSFEARQCLGARSGPSTLHDLAS